MVRRVVRRDTGNVRRDGTGGGSYQTSHWSSGLSSGAYSSGPAALNNGSATISIPAYSLVYGSDMLSAAYTPDAGSTGTFSGNAGTVTVSVARSAPAVSLTPASLNVTPLDTLGVTVTVGGNGAPVGSGGVIVSGGGYTSPSITLSGASSVVTIPAGALASGSDTLTVAYTPDAASSAWYKSGTATSVAISVDRKSVG